MLVSGFGCFRTKTRSRGAKMIPPWQDTAEAIKLGVSCFRRPSISSIGLEEISVDFIPFRFWGFAPCQLQVAPTFPFSSCSFFGARLRMAPLCSACKAAPAVTFAPAPLPEPRTQEVVRQAALWVRSGIDAEPSAQLLGCMRGTSSKGWKGVR